MITIERIIAFIMQAMAEDLAVSVFKDQIEVWNSNKNIICSFTISQIDVKIRTDKGETTIEITEPDYHKLLVLKDNIKKYKEDKALEEFNNFFKEDNKPTDINNLDDEED